MYRRLPVPLLPEDRSLPINSYVGTKMEEGCGVRFYLLCHSFKKISVFRCFCFCCPLYAIVSFSTLHFTFFLKDSVVTSSVS